MIDARILLHELQKVPMPARKRIALLVQIISIWAVLGPSQVLTELSRMLAKGFGTPLTEAVPGWDPLT